MRPLALLAALFLAAPSAAAPCLQADHSTQFPEGAVRDQCDIGSCHVFGAMALLEAAILRQHGKRVRLSEADLFAARVGAADDDAYDAVMNDREGGFVGADLRFALDHGVAYARSGDYDAMAARYDETPPRANRAKTEKRFRTLAQFMPRRLALRLALADEKRRDAKSPMSPADMEREMLGGEEAVARARLEREEVRGLLEGFQIESLPFKIEVKDGLECRTAGQAAARAITELMCRAPKGMPVGVSMKLDGLSDWGGVQGNHAFVLSGFKTGPGGAVFESRNSWGGNNPAVRDFEACRIHRVHAVLTKSDITLPAPEGAAGLGEAAAAPRDGGKGALKKAKGIAGSLDP